MPGLEALYATSSRLPRAEVSITLTAAVHKKGCARQQVLLRACLRNG